MRSTPVLAVSFVLSALTAVGCSSQQTAASAPASAPEPGAASMTIALDDTSPITCRGANISVNGMSCPKCAENIAKIIDSMDGVSHSSVNLEVGGVLVAFEENATHPSASQLASAIRDAGFTPIRVVATR